MLTNSVTVRIIKQGKEWGGKWWWEELPCVGHSGKSSLMRWRSRGNLQDVGRQPCGTWRQSVPGKNPGSRERTAEASVLEQVSQGRESWKMSSELWGWGRKGVADHVEVYRVTGKQIRKTSIPQYGLAQLSGDGKRKGMIGGGPKVFCLPKVKTVFIISDISLYDC